MARVSALVDSLLLMTFLMLQVFTMLLAGIPSVVDVPAVAGKLAVAGVPRAQKKETQARANCSAVPTQLALCLRLAIDL